VKRLCAILRWISSPVSVGGRAGRAITLNGVLPAPLVRLREGQNVRLHVENTLDEETSIHWHGLILPFQMDGVPGISFPGIKARSLFTYEFPVKQSGTYWYHSHSGLQEQLGHYGPIVIDPAGADPIGYDREHVVVLSDWTFLDPHQLFNKLKQEGGYFNRQKQTLSGLIAGGPGETMSASERLKWGKMRMDPADDLHLSDQRPRPAGELDGPVSSRRARSAAHHQCLVDVDLQHPHPGAQDERRRDRRAECPAGGGRRIPDRDRRNL
jgi:FtsP/CotA-like multicopper oxidase with cupredoxin domain